MADAQEFLSYSEGFFGAVRWATGAIGRRLVGVLAILADAVAQGATQVVANRLPGHPDCAPDARDQIGSDRALFRFRNESDASWGTRIQEAWTQYAQGGTHQAIEAELDVWGKSAFPATWISGGAPSGAFVEENGWATFTVWIPAGVTGWTAGALYGAGERYGDGTIYGVGDADAVDVDHLRRLIAKWKPARSHGRIQVLDYPAEFYGGGHTYGDGGKYAGSQISLGI